MLFYENEDGEVVKASDAILQGDYVVLVEYGFGQIIYSTLGKSVDVKVIGNEKGLVYYKQIENTVYCFAEKLDTSLTISAVIFMDFNISCFRLFIGGGYAGDHPMNRHNLSDTMLSLLDA